MAPKFKLDITPIALLIVTLPLLFVAINIRKKKTENFAASQPGTLIQLASSRVLSEQQMVDMMEANKRQVVSDILDMTEPEGRPGPIPAGALGIRVD